MIASYVDGHVELTNIIGGASSADVWYNVTTTTPFTYVTVGPDTFIKTWPAKAPAGAVATNGANTNIKYVADGFAGGKPCVRYGGNAGDDNRMLTTTTAPGVNDYSLVFVFSTTNTVQQNKLFQITYSTGGSDRNLYITANGNMLTRHIVGANIYEISSTLPAPGIADGQPHVAIVTCSRVTGLKLFIDGQLAGERPAATGDSTVAVAAPIIGRAFLGDIAEFMIYNHPLGDGERSTLELILKNRYGI